MHHLHVELTPRGRDSVKSYPCATWMLGWRGPWGPLGHHRNSFAHSRRRQSATQYGAALRHARIALIGDHFIETHIPIKAISCGPRLRVTKLLL